MITYFFVPDKTGIDLADEDAEFMKYLIENGWEGEVGEEDEIEIVNKAIESEQDDLDSKEDV